MGVRDIEKHRLNDHNYHKTHNNNNYPNYPHQQQQQQVGYYGRKTKRNWKSWLIPLIIVADIAIFVVVMFVNNCPKNNFGFDGCVLKFLGPVSFQPFRENPLLGPSSNTLLKMGGLQWDRVVHQHQGWRLVTCIWLHAGIVHLLVNMLTLVFIGIRMEKEFGFLRVGVLYVVSGIGGSILSSLFLQRNISVGASGALFGLLGGMLADVFINWTIVDNKAAILFNLLFMIAINLAIGILPMVDNFAHIGGFITGFLLGFILLVLPQHGWKERHHLAEHARPKTKYLAYQQVLFIFASVTLIAWLTVALVLLFQGKNGNDHCKWCHYLNCVPTSKWKCDI